MECVAGTDGILDLGDRIGFFLDVIGGANQDRATATFRQQQQAGLHQPVRAFRGRARIRVEIQRIEILVTGFDDIRVFEQALDAVYVLLRIDARAQADVDVDADQDVFLVQRLEQLADLRQLAGCYRQRAGMKSLTSSGRLASTSFSDVSLSAIPSRYSL